MVATDGETGRRLQDNFKTVLFNVWKQRNERPKVGGVSIRSVIGTVLRLEKDA